MWVPNGQTTKQFYSSDWINGHLKQAAVFVAPPCLAMTPFLICHLVWPFFPPPSSPSFCCCQASSFILLRSRCPACIATAAASSYDLLLLPPPLLLCPFSFFHFGRPVGGLPFIGRGHFPLKFSQLRLRLLLCVSTLDTLGTMARPGRGKRRLPRPSPEDQSSGRNAFMLGFDLFLRLELK